jgi:hypothetical protein
VLVRDEAAKAEVIKKYGQRMLVLTVFECKGLEFQVSHTRTWAMYQEIEVKVFVLS